ncbi:MAG TPA: hypothetical protein QF564_04765 [Pirellulaceae bacterium]|nr:hypothetical protein [Pirellulaceae bacterium]
MSQVLATGTDRRCVGERVAATERQLALVCGTASLGITRFAWENEKPFGHAAAECGSCLISIWTGPRRSALRNEREPERAIELAGHFETWR